MSQTNHDNYRGSQLLDSDIDGTVENGETGFKVATNEEGTRVFVPTHNEGDGAGGNVKVYDWDGSSWIQVGTTVYGQYLGTPGLGFALSCSSSGHRFATNGVVGSRVYEYVNDAWSQIGSEFSNSDNFRVYSIAMSGDGNRVVFGNKHFAPHDVGCIRVFDWDDSSSQWNQVGNEITGIAAFDIFGESVAISEDGTTIAAGAPHADNGSGDTVGYVRIFRFAEGDAETSAHWTQIGSNIAGISDYNYFGGSCALSSNGGRVVIGSEGNTNYVQVYDYDDSDGWVQVGTNLMGFHSFDQFGRSVSISNNGLRVVAGGRSHHGGGWQNKGHVRVFDWDSEGQDWTLIEEIYGEDNQDRFGEAVALSGDGSRLAVGAPQANNGGTSDVTGHVQVWLLSTDMPSNEDDETQAQEESGGGDSGSGTASGSGDPYICAMLCL